MFLYWGNMNFDSIWPWVTSCFKPRPFSTRHLRSTVMGTIIGVSFVEVTIYMLLKNSASAGEIPNFVADVLVVCIGAIEFLLSPFMSWLGHRRPRGTMIFWHVVMLIFVTPLMFIYIPQTASEADSHLCSAGNVTVGPEMSTKSIVSLTVLIVMAITCILARVSIWAHGIAQLDLQEPHRMSLHFSILVMARMLALLLVKFVVKDMIPNRMVQHTFSIIGPCCLNLVFMLIFRIESSDEDKRCEDKRADFFSTLGRVITNKLALVQTVGMGLLAAAAWGFAISEQDIIKVKYHIVPGDTMDNNVAFVMQFNFITIFAVILFGYQNSAPMLPELNVLNALKRTVKLCVILGALHIAITLIKCQPTPMVGLSTDTYIRPLCSQQCGCAFKWDQFSPVCDINSMFTYASPCHAGCSSNATVNGVTTYSNCSCGISTSQLSVGACNIPSCQLSMQMHQFLFAIVIIVSILGFQSQGAVILRAVNPRDKSVAFGVLSAVVALFAPIGGHIIYLFVISGNNCAWYQGGTCLLQGSHFPVTVTATCATIVFLTAFINLVSYFVLRRDKNKTKEPTD